MLSQLHLRFLVEVFVSVLSPKELDVEQTLLITTAAKNDISMNYTRNDL